jgi:large subunit ribosomal protein L35Ae
MVYARVVQFRRGRRTITPRHILIEIEGIDSKEKTAKWISKTVEWMSSAKKKITGKIVSAHGCKGLVRAIFEAGLPGQAIGSEVKILE